MSKMFNRARMSVTSTGTGTLTLGGAVLGYQSFATAGVANGDTVSYVIEDGANFEFGTGTYTSAGTTLSRTVTQSYNGTTYGTSPISVTTSAQVFITALAADLTSAANITSGTLGVANGGTGLSSLTANYIPYGNGTSAFASSSTLTYNNATTTLTTGVLQANNSSNWNYSNTNLIRNASNTASPRFIAMALDGDSLASTVIGGYNAIWGVYDSAPTTGSTSSALNGGMIYGAYATHRWYINGSEKMRISSVGDVSIGTTAANAKLTLNATSLGATSGNTANIAQFYSYTGNGDAIEFLYSRNASTPTNWTTADAIIRRNVDSTAGQHSIRFNGDGSTAFNWSSTELLRITSGGNVGIGVAPTQKLDVSNNANSGTLVKVSNPNVGASAYTGFNLAADTASATLFAASSGAANPNSVFLRLDSGTGGLYLDTATAAPIIFRTNSLTERMRIDSSGRVGIGVSSPSCVLETQPANNSTQGPLGAAFQTLFDRQGNASARRLLITQDTYRPSIQAQSLAAGWVASDLLLNVDGGNIGIGINAAPAQKLDVNGSVALRGSTSGSITLTAKAVAGSNTLTLPASTGTISTTGFAVAMSVVFGG